MPEQVPYMDAPNPIYTSSFKVRTSLVETMRFLANAELYPLTVEPGWETAQLGEVRKDGLEFDVLKNDD
jgi:hypothetical protein